MPRSRKVSEARRKTSKADNGRGNGLSFAVLWNFFQVPPFERRLPRYDLRRSAVFRIVGIFSRI